jgi:hypothetical protein
VLTSRGIESLVVLHLISEKKPMKKLAQVKLFLRISSKTAPFSTPRSDARQHPHFISKVNEDDKPRILKWQALRLK